MKELGDQEKYLESLITAKGDEYEIKKQGELVAETKRMIPEIEAKFLLHKEELSKFLDTYKGDENTDEARSLI